MAAAFERAELVDVFARRDVRRVKASPTMRTPLFAVSRNTPWMNTLRKPRLNSTVVSVAVDTFFSASRL